MITEWKLSNFKSFGDAVTTLRFAPLTIIAGANSSGKSSLLQSILLIAQTLSNKVSTRQLLLNGDLLKLGTFRSAIHENSPPHARMSIAFTLLRLPGTTHSRRGTYFPYWRFSPQDSVETEVRLEFGPAISHGTGKPEGLQAELFDAFFRLRVTSPNGSISVQTLELQRRSQSEIQELLSLYSNADQFAPLDMQYAVRLFPEDRSKRSRRRSDAEPVAMQLDHFLPGATIDQFSPARRRLVDTLAKIVDTSKENEASLSNESSLKEHLASFAGRVEGAAIVTLLQDFLSTLTPKEEAHRLLAYLSFSRSDKSTTLFNDICEDAFKALPEQIKRERVLEYNPPPDALHSLSAAIAREFSEIRYLGPLRGEPKPVYRIANSADASHVGCKGEFTAAVLDLYSGQNILCPLPNSPGLHHVTLGDATVAWLSHFDMAVDINTSEEGNLGHRLSINPGYLKRSLDLTHVGVGVSQLLPLLVMTLIAEPGSVLLFEQPELHLHPKVQSLLGDFFVAVSQGGKQCIVETHSEYLVNRLRLRVAEAPRNSPLGGHVVYFVDRKDGVSCFKQVEIDEYGAITPWPVGFFDQGPMDAERILLAGAKKRKEEKMEKGRLADANHN